MNRAQKIAAEPQMEDILASIKRAIGGERALVSDKRFADMELRRAGDPSRTRAANDGGRAVAVVPAVRTAGRELRVHLGRDSERDARTATAEEIEHLRNKIARELTIQEAPLAPVHTLAGASQEDVTDRATPKREPRFRQATSLFRSLLGGEEESDESLFEPLSPPPSSLAPALRGSLAEESRAYLRAVQKPIERAVPFNVVAVHEPVAEPLRSAFDEPTPNTPGMRPPFGQGSMGIRAYSPATHDEDDELISSEVRANAKNVFARHAEELVDREIDETGQQDFDGLAREVLQPMLRQWLDRHLPGLVEDVVREVIERVSRRGVR